VGSLYRRGAVWWIKYYVDGRPVRESTGYTKEKAARREMKKREGRAASGLPILPRADRIRYEETAGDLRIHYKTVRADRAVPRWAKASLTRLDAFFTGRRVVAVTPTVVAEYVQERQAEGAANGTINRELAVLLRMLRLAYEHGKLARMPVIRKLKEAPPRAGFFERGHYEAVRRRLKPDLQAAVAVAYTYGWRVQEILGLERRHVDLEAGTLRLDPGSTKNDEGRVIYLTPELARLLGEQLERIRAVERKTGRIIPYLFPYLRGRRRQGTRRRDFRKSWATACVAAGFFRVEPVLDGEGKPRMKRDGTPVVVKKPTKLVHDFRRTAVRNLVNAGVPERVAMSVTGHKTRSVFDRYHIVSPADLQTATRRLIEADGHTSGHSATAALDGRAVTIENT
jgi:integrase